MCFYEKVVYRNTGEIPLQYGFEVFIMIILCHDAKV